MGKLPPSMRSAPLPLAFLKPLQQPPSSSSSSSSASPQPIIKPQKPFSKILKPSKSTNKSKSQKTQQKTTLSPPLPDLFTSPSLSSAIATFNSLSHLDPNTILQSFISTNPSPSPKDTLSFFTHILTHSPSFSPSRSSFISLINHHCISSVSPEPVFALMSSHGFQPDPSTLDIAIRSLCSVSRLDNASQLALDFPVTPDEFTYNFLVRQLAKSRPISSVYRVIDLLRSKRGIEPNLVTYTILIDCVCRSKNLREATRLLNVLGECGFKPDCYLYNTIMKGYCMLDQCGEVMEVYNRMKDEGVEPDLVTYNTLVYGLSKAGMVDQANKFLGVMAGMGHFPDTVTYTSLMNGMCRKRDALGAVALLGEMEEKGCSPNECTYNTLLMGLCKAKFLVKGMEMYEVMKRRGMKLEAAAYATFVRTLCRANKIAEAYEVFDYVLETKSLTEISAYLALESSFKWAKKAKE